MPHMNDGWTYYIHTGCGWFRRFVSNNAAFQDDGFLDYVVAHNRADRDAGELDDIALHEVLRLAAEYEERRWRFANVYGEPPKAS